MLIDTLREESKGSIVAYTEFLELFKKNDNNIIYCFFEGDDDYDYYKTRIESSILEFFPLDFNCGGKEGVLYVYDLIKGKTIYKNTKTAYFIDRDFDPLQNNEEIYETPCYSLENLYTDVSAVENILKSRFKIPRGSVDMSLCLGLYTSFIKDFHCQTLFLNSWLSCYADLRNGDKIIKRVKTDKKTKQLFDDVVMNNLSGVRSIPEIIDFDSIRKLFDNSTDVSKQDFDNKVEAFKEVDQSKTFRGKFEIKFLISFLKRLDGLIGNKKTTVCTKTYSCTLKFTEPPLTLLSNYAITPTCLIEYIQRVAGN